MAAGRLSAAVCVKTFSMDPNPQRLWRASTQISKAVGAGILLLACLAALLIWLGSRDSAAPTDRWHERDAAA
jgi:hypothetical protein